MILTKTKQKDESKYQKLTVVNDENVVDVCKRTITAAMDKIIGGKAIFLFDKYFSQIPKIEIRDPTRGYLKNRYNFLKAICINNIL